MDIWLPAFWLGLETGVIIGGVVSVIVMRRYH